MTRLIRIGPALMIALAIVAGAEEHPSASEMRQMKAALLQSLSIERDQPWSEQTAPVVSIEAIDHVSATVRIVRACEFQPTLLAPGMEIEATLIKGQREWRVSSVRHLGFCDLSRHL